MNTLYNQQCDPKTLSPLTLAFIGDGVYDLFVREKLVCDANCAVGKLNDMKVKKVCCTFQSQAIKSILYTLTEEEVSIYKRGRNAHTCNTPKNSNKADYHAATGLEALFGYLYLKGDINRLREIFNLIIKDHK